MKKTKKMQAEEFIEAIKVMSPGILLDHIESVAGGELSQFFIDYAVKQIRLKPNTDTASALMLLGYLIRAREDREAARQDWGHVGKA